MAAFLEWKIMDLKLLKNIIKYILNYGKQPKILEIIVSLRILLNSTHHIDLWNTFRARISYLIPYKNLSKQKIGNTLQIQQFHLKK